VEEKVNQMNALQKNLGQIWDQLRSQKATRPDYLERIQVKNFRGIKDILINLPFPVCVLAGANGCGKSTVLFALACTYRGDTIHDSYTPAKIFPDFQPKLEAAADLADQVQAAELVLAYVENNQPLSMLWKRGSQWSKSYFGRRRGQQPKRPVYLHTLSKLTNPSEVRSVIQLAQRQFQSSEIDASNVSFAQRILGFNYVRLRMVVHGKRSLLVAERTEPTTLGAASRYSEFHMSAGERAVIRLSLNLSKLENALVLIDEVEAGLHPHVQQLLMLELQRLALRNRLQIICTSHSPAIIDSVPLDARIFLERREGNVVRREAYRDIVQKALYGQSQQTLSFMCEDEESEGFVRGLFDHLGPKLDFLQNDIVIGRDTGKDEFPAHLETLARFRKLSDIVFVLDGDGRGIKLDMEQRASQAKQSAQIICLPSNDPPEVWIWDKLKNKTEDYAEFFALTTETLIGQLNRLDNVYSNAADKPTAIAKNKLFSLCEESSKSLPQLFRYAARKEAEIGKGEVNDIIIHLENLVRDWRSSQI
jgi:predicted ATPase